MTRLTRWYLGTAGVLTLLFLIDRLSKNLALALIDRPRVLVPGLLELRQYANTDFLYLGVIPFGVTVTAIILVMLLLSYLAMREYAAGHHWHVSLLALILVGAYSNLYDRIRYGAVIDFIMVPRWSVFNLSDLYIVAGVGAMLFLLWRRGEKRHPHEPPAPVAS
jgi:lipoprotein signal peptidase